MGISPIQLQKSLKGVGYPADRDALVEHARSASAGDETVDALRNIPDRTYDGPNAVSKAVFDRSRN